MASAKETETKKNTTKAAKKVTNKPKKVANKKVKKESYLKGVKKEMGLVKWPTWKEVIKNTIATLVLIIIVCGFFLLLTVLLSVVKDGFNR